MDAKGCVGVFGGVLGFVEFLIFFERVLVIGFKVFSGDLR